MLNVVQKTVSGQFWNCDLKYLYHVSHGNAAKCGWQCKESSNPLCKEFHIVIALVSSKLGVAVSSEWRMCLYVVCKSWNKYWLLLISTTLIEETSVSL